MRISTGLRLTWVQYLGLIANGFVFNIVGPILPSLQQQLKLNYGQAGLILSGMFFGELLSVMAGGFLADRLGKKPFLLGGGIIFTLGLFGCALAGGYESLLLSTVVTGVGFGVYEVGMNALCADTSQENRGRAMNFLHMFFGFGAILAPVLGILCINVLGSWRFTFALTAFFPIVATILLFPVSIAPVPRASRSANKELYGTSFIWVASFTILAYLGIEVVMSGWLPTFWLHLPRTSLPASLTVTIFWAALTVGRTFSGRMADSLGYGKFIIGMSVVTCIITLGWFLYPSAFLTLATIIGTGLTVAGMYPTIMASATARHPARTGEVAALISLFAGVGGFAIAAGVGKLADLFDVTILPLTLLAVAVLMMAGAFLGWGGTGRSIRGV